MAILKEKSSHLWQRDEHDWYVEPLECSLALFKEIDVPGTIWDPAAGCGRILASAQHFGKKVFGTDVKERSEFCSEISNFLFDDRKLSETSIVSNPPFRHAEEFVSKAIDQTGYGYMVAMLLPIVWMAGFSSKRDWLPNSPLFKILPMSPRPSMPPGQVLAAGERPGNGTKDFAWFVWKIGYTGAPEVHFLNTKTARHLLKFVNDPMIVEDNWLCGHRQAAIG